MVHDGAVKDQQQHQREERSPDTPAPSASAVTDASAAAAVVAEAGAARAGEGEAAVGAGPSKPGSDKRLGVRHPVKYRRFRAKGKAMAEPGATPAHQPLEEELELELEEGEGEVEEEASSPEREVRAGVVEVEVEVEVEMEVEVSSAAAAAAVGMEVEEGAGMDVSPAAAVAMVDSEHSSEEEEEEEVSSSPVLALPEQARRKQGHAVAAAVPALVVPKDQDLEKEKKEKERQRERDRVDEVGYMSGGCKSDDGSLSCGYSSFRGKRATMEDFFDIKSSKIDDKQINLFGIFDGHGGSRAAEYLKEHLFENLMKHPQFMSDTKLAISETYKKTDSDFLDSEINTHRDDGSTASTAVLLGNHLYVANVGDSRAVISKSGKAIALSDDHKPNRSDERKRIESAGGIVMWAGTWRVGGVLAMSRAFGNRLLKQFVVAEPEIQDQEIDDELEFLILASDGLWDVVPNEDAVSLVKMEEDPEAAARKLTETAFGRGSGDNITCVVVKFQHSKAAGDQI
ncbi:probable protein phosphatase 2C 52 isoform X2 [Triticum dicoccoides]|uniref:probable protein phosphatase 2C 52 isoform X2 n=1 Tax=Triticum dicoccoides TaxID=85692 RepID=UPI00188DF2AC|nr:probable protein phosphatase 2C 52 isoform X2 [Triticum dicoccoides]